MDTKAMRQAHETRNQKAALTAYMDARIFVLNGFLALGVLTKLLV